MVPVPEKLPERSGLVTPEGQPVPLIGVEVSGEVAAGVARMTVRQRYRNTESKPVEAVYTFPLPTGAALAGFSMTCAGRRLDGVVKEREEAFQAYDEALTAGHGAALLERERPNVFTAQIGNLLPQEETQIEVVYLQRAEAEEGALRLTIPTVVAPRYVPGTPAGDRTGGGWAEPTDRVPDADRVTPPIGDAPYGLRLDLVVDLGAEVEVESPSHALTVTREEGSRARVALAAGEAALDRDLVLLLRTQGDAGLTALTAHRGESGPGTFALTVVPDLATGEAGAPRANDVVFLLDVSGSMDGLSLPQAKAALKLCLRHLRGGDRFNIIAFSSGFTTFRSELTPFTDASLRDADRFLEALGAHGGTDMLEPLLLAVRQAPDGVVVLLTDGQVANEEEIQRRVLETRRSARVFSFGIGTAVSDALLTGLARQTGGAVESIYPGERIDEKVVAQFARATAERVDGVTVRWQGVEVEELAPAELPALVDGQPWLLTGRYQRPEAGSLELKGSRRGLPFTMRLDVVLPARAERPALVPLWAQQRVEDLLGAQLVGRRAHAMKDRIVALAVEHGLATPYTSFLVVETRSGERRASGQPETRVVPVRAPFGWDMLAGGRPSTRTGGYPVAYSLAPPAPGGMAAPARMPPPPGAPAGIFGTLLGKLTGSSERARATAPPPPLPPPPSPMPASVPAQPPAPLDPDLELLSRQLASGLWEGSRGPVRTTAAALLELSGRGITTRHRLHGPQVEKAVEALLAELAKLASGEYALAELALLAMSLVSSGRARKRVEEAAARRGVVLPPEVAARERARELL